MADTQARDVKVQVSSNGSEYEPKTLSNIVPTVGSLRQVLGVPANCVLTIDGESYPDNDAVIPEEDRYIYVGWEANTKTGGNFGFCD